MIVSSAFFRASSLALVLSMGLLISGTRSAFSAGTEGASFLDIPVGAGPASMGSAYTAMANNAYAPTWNPAGLGRLDSVQVTGTHLAYLNSLRYEYVSGVLPLADKTSGIGASVQYLGSGNIDGRDPYGNATGSFNTTFAAYALAYGARLTDGLSVGITGKAITEKISDVSGHAYAVDAGAMYRPMPEWGFGAALANVGSEIRLVDESDPLPLAFRAGTVFDPDPAWRFALEGVYRKYGPASAQLGVEWKYGTVFAIRGGYNTSHVQGISAGAGLSAGLSIFFMGQEFAYAYLPYGDLGGSHYLSLVFRFSREPLPNRPVLVAHDTEFSTADPTSPPPRTKPKAPADYDEMYDLLNDDERKALKRGSQPDNETSKRMKEPSR